MWLLITALFAPSASAATVPDVYPTLAQAVANTAPGGVIDVAPGSWGGGVVIDKPLEIRGTDHAVDTVILGQSASAIQVTNGASVTLRNVTLDGMGAHRGLSVGPNASVELVDAWCIQGSTNGGGGTTGGCVFVESGAFLYAERVTFLDSYAQYGGGHIGIIGGEALVVDSRLVGGQAQHGGAIWVDGSGSHLTLLDSQLGGNEANNYGGAVLVLSSSATVGGSRFHGNSAGSGGGAIFVQSSAFSADSSVFVQNYASAEGGGISFLSAPDPIVERSVFVNNTAVQRGGGISASSSNNLLVRESWLRGNYAQNQDGGGIYATNSGSVRVYDTLLRQNSASGDGGGVLLQTGTGHYLDRNLYCMNYAASRGGAVAARNTQHVDVRGSVFTYNEAAIGGGTHVTGSNIFAYQNVMLGNYAYSGGAHQHFDGNATGDYNSDSYLNLMAWAFGGVPGYWLTPTYNLAYSDQNWYFSNSWGDYLDQQGSIYFYAGPTGNPGLSNFNINAYDCEADVRPSGPMSQGPQWTGGSAPRWYTDADGDGFEAISDCDDNDKDVHPASIWYRDADADGRGTTSSTFVGCTPPTAEFVLQAGDCNDNDPRLQSTITVYTDNDGDGFGNPATASQHCGLTPPAGKVLNGSDCNDNDPLQHPGQTWYVDNDGDGYGSNGSQVTQCARPTNGVLVGGDCDDNDPDEYPGQTWYIDNDGDGFGSTSVTQCARPTNGVLVGNDCNDNDSSEFPGQTWYIDNDGDGFGGTSVTQCARPANGLLVGGDCNDSDSDEYPGQTWYIDGDGDGYGGDAVTQCARPADGLLVGGDCNDSDPVEYPGQTWYVDNDGDGFGSDASQVTQCAAPNNGVLVGGDCDDADADAFPGQTWFIDADGDSYGADGSALVQCARPTSGVLVDGDCDDGNGAIHPSATEVCNGVDDDCDGATDDEDTSLDLGTASTWYEDLDGDTFGNALVSVQTCEAPVGFVDDDTDCDDTDDTVHGPLPWWPDVDGDGFGDAFGTPAAACEMPAGFVGNTEDCDDSNANVHPDTVWYLDDDGDGFGDDAEEGVVQCEPIGGRVWLGGDCDDTDADVNPGATEVCNEIDDDCNDLIDDEDDGLDLSTAFVWFPDADGDGYGAGDPVEACVVPAGHTDNDLDCDDTDSLIHPAAPEQCDEVDHNCDDDPLAGVVDLTWYRDDDGDGYGQDADTLLDCVRPDGYALLGGDCQDDEPQVNPGQLEVCNGVDDNCDGNIDEGAVDAGIWAPDADGDGFGDLDLAEALCEGPAGWVQTLGDCDDGDDTVFPGAIEVCNGQDDDCNGAVDDGVQGAPLWYVDADDDGWGDEEGTSVAACQAPEGYAPAGDCDDSDADVNPDAVEVCNGVDDDCNGDVDDDDAGLDTSTTTTWWPDGDGDGFGDAEGVSEDSCAQPDGYVDNDDDCDDADADEHLCDEEPGDTADPIDVNPPSSGKEGKVPPKSPSGYGIGCAHGGTTAPGWVALLGALMLVRRRRA